MDEQRMTKADMAREWIAKEIRIGNFARGSVLPPERELAVQIGVSYMTAQGGERTGAGGNPRAQPRQRNLRLQ